MSLPAYPAYIDVGVDWLGKIPAHWQQKWLGLLAAKSHAAFVDGPFGSDLKSSDYQDEGIPLIQLNNIRDGRHVLRNMKFISEEKRDELSRHSAFPGDVVIAKMADPVARSAIVSEGFSEYVIVADCVKMTPNLASVDLSFLIWAVNSDCVRISAELMSSGVTRIRINLGQVKKLKIPYPPLCEQTQIARFLDDETARIDALIEEQQRLIELLKEKRQAVISRAVTKGLDPTVPMKDSGVEWLGEVPVHWTVCQVRHLMEGDTRNGLYKPEGEKDPEGVGFVQMGEAFKDRIFQGGVKDRVQASNAELKNWGLEEGDLLFARRSIVLEGSGRCTRIGSLNEPHLFESSMIRVRLDSNRASPEYLHFMFDSVGMRAQVLSTTKTVTISGIDSGQLKGLRMAVPSKSEQENIAAYLLFRVEAFDEAERLAMETTSLLQERRSALISAVVTGKIDVRDWQPPASAS
ncbi:MAG: restriction endonuclease subunit S [Pseudomonadaceae bacterium]